MPKARVSGISLYYETHGRGEPLLLIMGLGGGSSLWWDQVEYFAPEYRVVVYDSRGVGRTGTPDGPFSMTMMVEDAAGLLQRLGIHRAHVYGVSMGGMVAQELALRYPGMVSSLVLGATTCGGPQAVLPQEDALREIMSIMTLPPSGIARVAASVTFSPDFMEHHPDQVRQWLRKGAEGPPSAAGFARQAEALAGFETWGRLGQITAPTLVLSGTADRLIPVQNSRVLASAIPGAELVLFEGAGHGYLWEAAERANRAVRDFLRRHRESPAGGGPAPLTTAPERARVAGPPGGRPAHPRRFSTDLSTLEKEVVVEPYRAPGPGGQRKNRKETAVRLTHPPSGLTVVASERRSQAQNREVAFARLVKKLTELNRPRKRRVPTRPSAGAIRRQREAKEKLSRKKHLRAAPGLSDEPG